MEPPAHPRKFKRTHTVVILACLFLKGSIFALLGYALRDLKEMFATESAGILVGSFISGCFLYKHVDAKIAVALSLLAGGLGTAIVPHLAPDIWIASVGLFVTAFSFGALEVGASIWLVRLWGDRINPIMQSYHVSYFVGLCLGNGAFDIAIGCGVFGGACAVMGFVILFLMLIDRSPLRQHDTLRTNDAAQRSVIRFEWTVVSLLCAFIVTEALYETIMGSMLALYVSLNPYLAMDDTEVIHLLTFYDYMFLAGRIASVFVSFKLKPNSSLIIAQGISAVGSVILLLLVFPAASGRVTVWLATGMIGFGLGPLYPTAITWTVQNIHLKYAHMSAALIAACLGDIPVYLVRRLYPSWVESSISGMPLVTAPVCIFLTGILAAMLFTTRNKCPIFDKGDEEILVAEMEE